MKDDSSSKPARSIALATRNLGNNTGISRNVQEQIRMFSNLGMKVHVYAERVNTDLVDLGNSIVHRIRRWPLPKAWHLRAFDMRVRRRLRAEPETPLLSHGDVRTRDVLLIHNCVHLAHEILNDSPLPEDDPTGQLHKKFITEPNLALLIANSQLMADDFQRRFPLAVDHIPVLFESYSSEIFNAGNRQQLRRLGRERLGISEDARITGLITSGDFRKRNVDGLLRAASLTKTDIHWVVVGKDRNQSYYERLARELGISERVHFHPVVRDVEQYYHALDLFVLPAHIEEFGRSALEAMACATPVVLGPKVGCAELLTGRARQGLLENLDPVHIARTIDHMFSDAAELEATAQECALIAPEYREQRQAERLLELLHARFPGRFPATNV